MSRMKKAAACLLAAALMIGSLAGCSSSLRGVKKEDYPALTAATYGDQEICLGEVNFYLRNLQYVYEMIYGTYYGDEMWDLAGSGSKTMGQSVKENVLSEIYQIYVLNGKAEELNVTLSEEDLAKVETAVDEYLEGTPQTILDETNLSREELIGIYQRNAVANRVWEAAVKDVDTEVSDEEACQRKVTVMVLSDSSEEYVSEEMKDEVLASLKDGLTMSEIADEKGLTASPYTMDEGDYADTIGPAAMALEEGGYDAVYNETNKAWYVLYCDSEFDEEATESRKAEIVEERKSAAFEETYKQWKTEAAEFKVDEDVIALLDFKTAMYVAETTAAGSSEEETTEAEETTAGSEK